MAKKSRVRIGDVYPDGVLQLKYNKVLLTATIENKIFKFNDFSIFNPYMKQVERIMKNNSKTNDPKFKKKLQYKDGKMFKSFLSLIPKSEQYPEQQPEQQPEQEQIWIIDIPEHYWINIPRCWV